MWASPHPEAQESNRTVVVRCAASRTGPLAQTELMTRQCLEIFSGVRRVLFTCAQKQLLLPPRKSESC